MAEARPDGGAALRTQELRTLAELARAFGREPDAEAIRNRLALALMGQLLVGRVAVAVPAPGGGLRVALARGAAPGELPAMLEALDAPTALEPSAPPGGFVAALPLRAGDALRGVVLVGPRAAGVPFDPATLDFAGALAALAAGALETADRMAERLARERLDEELRLARDLQRRLLPARLPDVPGLEAAVRWEPSRTVSGDTYEAAALPGGRLLVAVADVVGKGVAAALLMATVQAGLRMLRPEIGAASDAGAALARATARLNGLVAESTAAHEFVTLAWAVADPAAGCVWSVAAGHPAPRLVRADGTVRALAAGGPLLGVVPEARYAAEEAPFAPGSALVLVSDGLLEAQDAHGDDWGEARLDAALARHAGRPVSALLDALAADARAFDAGAAEADDLTLLGVARRA